MKFAKLITVLTLTLVLLVALPSPTCAAGDEPFTLPETLYMPVGSTLEFASTRAPLVIASSDPAVALYQASMLIALHVGETSLTLPGGESSTVVVLPKEAAIETDAQPLVIGRGGKAPFLTNTTMIPVSADLIVTIADPDIATYEGGAIFGHKEGETSVTVSLSGELVSITRRVWVVKREKCTNLKATIPYRLRVGETLLIDAFLTPRDTTDGLFYHSSEPAIASVSPTGAITAHMAGKTTIFVSCGEKTIAQVVYVR